MALQIFFNVRTVTLVFPDSILDILAFSKLQRDANLVWLICFWVRISLIRAPSAHKSFASVIVRVV